MKLKLFSLGAIVFILIFVFQSCKKENEGETKISKNGTSESHNVGKNCMNCHKSGGEGEGIFMVAGTVYDESMSNTYKNATVKLYTGADGTGTLKYTIEGDELGNFYTTENIDFSGNLYPVVIGTSTKYMGSSISTGQCNSCHGASTDKIWVN